MANDGGNFLFNFTDQKGAALDFVQTENGQRVKNLQEKAQLAFV
jgi:hypothetical protein